MLPPASLTSSHKRLSHGPFELSLDLLVGCLPLAPPLDPVDSFRMFAQLSEFTRPPFCPANRTKLRHRFSILGNNDGVAARRVLDKPRELSLGFVQIDLSAHILILKLRKVSGQHVGQPIKIPQKFGTRSLAPI